MTPITEFWFNDAVLVRVDGIVAPRVGEFVSILGKTYEVAKVGWAVDHAAEWDLRAARCNVELKEPTP